MAISNFKPTIWSDLIDNGFMTGSHFVNLANTKYEGDIKNGGEVVKILSIGDVSVRSYTGSGLIYDAIDDNVVNLAIDQKYYAGLVVDDADKVQATPSSLNGVTAKIGQALAKNIDTYVGTLHAGAGNIIGNTTSGVVEVNSANALAQFTTMGKMFDENDAPEQGRVALVPAWLGEKLVLSKVASDTNNSEAYANGYIGSVGGFEVYKSNNLAKSGTSWWASMFFIKNESIALATQLLKVETVRATDSFADNVRALAVYGAKIINDKGVGTLYCKPKAEA